MLQNYHARAICVAFASAQARQISEIMFPLRTAELMGVSWPTRSSCFAVASPMAGLTNCMHYAG